MMNAVPATYQRQIAQVQHDLETNPARAQRYLDENDPLDNLASEALAGLVTKEGAEKLRLVVLNIRRSDPKSAIVAEEKINGLGYALLGLKKYPEAIAVFRMNTEDFPRSANCYDSYAEALFNSGKVPDAVENYKKALDVDSKYPNAEFATKFVAEHGKAN
jgi:tetratricopeptide (TPR) repeat protein